MNLLLHIGASKTGTTRAQWSLHHGRDKLLAEGIFYPQVAPHENHNLLAIPFLPGVPRMFWRDLGRSKADAAKVAQHHWAKIAAEVARASPAWLILSAEHMLPVRNPAALIAHIRTLMPQVREITVLCHVRAPDRYFVADLQQRLRASHVILPADPEAPVFQPCLDRWRALPGVRLVVQPYGRDADPDWDTLTDLLYHSGIGLISGLPDPADANDSLSAEGMHILQRFRAHGFADQDNVFRPVSNRLHKLLLGAEAALGGRAQYPRPRLRPDFAAHFASDLLDRFYLRDQFGIRFTPDDPPPRLPWPDHPVSGIPDLLEVDQEAAERLWSHVLLRLLRQTAAPLAKSAPLRPTGPAEGETP